MGYEYLIDSSAWLEYFTGTPKGMKIKRLIENETIATSIIAVFELADKFEREKRRFDVCLKFMQSRAEVLQLSVGIALNAAKLKNEIRKGKPKFGAADAIHLATAMNEDAKLVTADNDFSGLNNVMMV